MAALQRQIVDAPQQALQDRLQWLNGVGAPSLEDKLHATTAAARQCLKGVAHNRSHPSWKCCTPCEFNTFADSPVLLDKDFVDANEWRAAVCCGGGAPVLGGCWSFHQDVTDIIDEVMQMNQDCVLRNGRPFSNDRCRSLCLQKWARQHLPNTPLQDCDKLPIPVCVVARVRGVFQEPTGVWYGGRET